MRSLLAPVFVAFVFPAFVAFTSPAAAASQDARWPHVNVELRNGATALRLQGGETFHTTFAEVRDLRRIEIGGSSAFVVIWQEHAATGALHAYSAISLDGVSIAVVRETNGILQLEHGAFDPLGAHVPVDPALAADPRSQLRIVQLVTMPIEPIVRDLERLGLSIEAYVADHAYVVHLNGVDEARVAALPYVRWVGPHHAAYRLEPVLRHALTEVGPTFATQACNILLFRKSDEAKRAVVTRVLTLGGSVQNPDAGARLVEAVLAPEQLLAIARLDEVQYVDRWSAPEEDMDNAREIGGGNWFHATLGLTGAGVRGEVMDGGVRATHSAFSPAPLFHGGTPNVSSHGTKTFGIVFADGNACEPGFLPDGVGLFADYDLVSNRYQHTRQLVDPALPWQAVFQSNSWGSSLTTSYTTISADMDQTLFDHDILICQSQSNSGTQGSRPQAWAKNILSVGGIRHRNTLSTTDDDWDEAGSIGPASDGRIKPDLAHFYDSVATTTSSSDTACTTSFGGTSAATPIVAGHSGLWFQLWHTGLLGNTPGASVFASRPPMSLSKAMLICTADQWTFSGAAHDLTRTHQGFGRPNVKNIHDRRDRLYWVDESDVLTALASTVHLLDVAPGEPALRATLVYTDPPGNPAVQSQHRVNDLTLKVVSPAGTVYWGNQGLREGMWSTPGGTANHKDTVECVYVQAPPAGRWTVEVIAEEINLDAHLATPALDAAYALVVTGGTEPAIEPGQPFCPGDGSLATLCPCQNHGASGHGCSNSVHAEGAHMTAAGSVAADSVSLTVELLPPTALAIFIRSSAQNPQGIVFGDGLRCVTGALVRFGSQNASAGTATFPGASPVTLSQAGGTPPGSGITAWYQAHYRNADATFCTSATFNTSNGYVITW